MRLYMQENALQHFQETYASLLQQQHFRAQDLDYSILDRHIPILKQLASLGKSVVSVFDLHRQHHAFYSPDLGAILGYSAEEVAADGERFFDSRIHPDDFLLLMQRGLSILKLYYNFSLEEKLNHKFISEFRIRNAAGHYVRVIEQQQALELDTQGNLWLALSILDLSPNQKNLEEGLKSELLNVKTGSIIPFAEIAPPIQVTLTRRETEVLRLVREGYLSKEISDMLTISLHTVNTHRQRVLEKLGVNNSMEAIQMATRLNLI